MATMERVVSTSTNKQPPPPPPSQPASSGGGNDRQPPPHHPKAPSPADGNPPAAGAASSSAGGATAAASALADEHLGRSDVFAQLRHGHLQNRMGGPARFAILERQQQRLRQQEVEEEVEVGQLRRQGMRKHHTVHLASASSPAAAPASSSSSAAAAAASKEGAGGVDHGEIKKKGMSRQKTLDRLLHLRILGEDGTVVPTSSSSSSPQPIGAGAEGGLVGDEPATATAAAAAAIPAEAAQAAAAAAVMAPPTAAVARTAPPPRQRSYPPVPSTTDNASTVSSSSSFARRRPSWLAQQQQHSHASLDGGGMPSKPPSLSPINRSSSVIQETYQVTAAKWRLSILSTSILCLALYLLVSVAAYGYTLEKWGAVRALYFGIVTLTSVGFGDHVPTTQASKLFTIFFALVGISIVALAVGEISARLLEHQNRKVEEFQKLLSRRLAKKPAARARSLSGEKRGAGTAEKTPSSALAALAEREKEVEMSLHDTEASSHCDSGERGDDDITAMRGDIEAGNHGASSPPPSPSKQPQQPQPSPTGSSSGGKGRLVAWMQRAKSLRDMPAEIEVVGTFVHKLGRWQWSDLMWVLIKALLPVIVVNGIGAGIIAHLEGWTPIDAAYYAVISSTTIGYGDMHPEMTETYVLAIIYIPLAVCAVGNAISQIADYYMRKSEEKRRAAVLKRKYVWEDLIALDENGDEEIDIFEFTIYLLKLWGLVDDHILAAINERFKELDTDGSGTLTREDFLGAVLPSVVRDESDEGWGPLGLEVEEEEWEESGMW